MTKRWFDEGYEPEEMNPIEDIKEVMSQDRYKENPILVPAEMKDKFVEVANENHILVSFEGVWRKEEESR